MQLEDEDIREFSKLWQEEFNETLSPDEARHHASLLLELYVVLAGFPATSSGQAHRGAHQP